MTTPAVKPRDYCLGCGAVIPNRIVVKLCDKCITADVRRMVSTSHAE